MNAIKEKITRQSQMVWWMVNKKLVDLAWNDPRAPTVQPLHGRKVHPNFKKFLKKKFFPPPLRPEKYAESIGEIRFQIRSQSQEIFQLPIVLLLCRLERQTSSLMQIRLNNNQKKLHRASVAQCEVSAYAPSCRRCVATYWKEQTRRSQNCKYLP